ncbi:MAG: hypothetical protein ACI8W8_000348 [Rhodothermales bacterium]
MNEEFDNDTQLTAALFGELSADSAEALAADRPQELAELQGVLDALKADLPSDVTPLSDARRGAILAVAAELDASLAVLPPVEPPAVIETHWFRRQMPLIIAALFVLGAGVASLMLMNKKRNMELARVELQQAQEELEALPALSALPEEADVAAMAADNFQDEGLESGDLVLDDADVIDVTVSAADLADAIAVTATAPAAPEASEAEDEDQEAAREELADMTVEAPGTALKQTMGLVGDIAPAVKRRTPRSKAKMAARNQPKSMALSVSPAAESSAAIAAPEAALAASPVQPARAVTRAAQATPDQLPTPQAQGAQMVKVEHAPSPLHADRVLLVVHAPNSTVNFDNTLVQAHRQLAPGVYEVTLQVGARRGAFATVIVGDVAVPVAIEAGRPAFDQASVAYRIAVLKALDIKAIDHALPAKE